MKRALILAGGGARGSFQAGVWKFLQERGWDPHIICGTSIGAINAAGIGSGLSPEKLIQLWTRYHRKQMFRYQFGKSIAGFFKKKRYEAVADTHYMKEVLSSLIDFDALRKSPRDIIIAAANMRLCEPAYFSKHQITISHLMASSAIPLLFPWQVIHGEPYWDGCVLDNAPIQPAIDRGAKSIIVVMASPMKAYFQNPPQTPAEAAEVLVDQMLVASCKTTLRYIDQDIVNVRVVAPRRRLGLWSYLRFTPNQARQYVNEGYQCAQSQLASHLVTL